MRLILDHAAEKVRLQSLEGDPPLRIELLARSRFYVGILVEPKDPSPKRGCSAAAGILFVKVKSGSSLICLDLASESDPYACLAPAAGRYL